jgi:hypothetical protein
VKDQRFQSLSVTLAYFPLDTDPFPGGWPILSLFLHKRLPHPSRAGGWAFDIADTTPNRLIPDWFDVDFPDSSPSGRPTLPQKAREGWGNPILGIIERVGQPPFEDEL